MIFMFPLLKHLKGNPMRRLLKQVENGLKPLGRILKYLKEGFTNGWIDGYENQGKTGGRILGCYKTHPYVLLNYQEHKRCIYPCS